MTAATGPAAGSKHTPGPWMADGWDEIEEGVPVIAVHEEIGLQSPTRGMVAWCTTVAGAAFESPDRAYANARLIAAAPELLEALQAAMRFIDSHVADPDITRDMADAWSDLQRINPHTLIAKATGATP